MHTTINNVRHKNKIFFSTKKKNKKNNNNRIIVEEDFNIWIEKSN